MTVKGVKVKSESFFPISCGVLELRRKNLRGGGDRAKILSTTIIWPITQYRYITEVNFVWYRTEIIILAETVLVNVSRWAGTHTLHHPVISGPTPNPLSYAAKAAITRCDLSPRFLCIDATFKYCTKLRAIRYESTNLNRILADKSHHVIVAKREHGEILLIMANRY